ncbi:MAG: hypothetical protein KFH98_16550 [Gemmatimonadetes bacterium]|nr:hypothetical protein [Gemmatimonadota bacterium]
MRARILLAGTLILAAACSRPDADPEHSGLDDRAAPDLALTPESDAVPVASDVETNRPRETPRSEPDIPTPSPGSAPAPTPEPVGSHLDGEQDAAPVTSEAPLPVATGHAHPDAAPADVSAPAEEGGGKPTDISTGLGPVPDRTWGDPVIMDDPNPLPGLIGREGAVIIRGGNGGLHDDCKVLPGARVPVNVALPANGPAVLVNDRDPRRGAAINERAPRTANRPSVGRSSGFPRGGIR